jgi:TRAP-type C4-dicarboxylate transport system permease small subunit
MDPLSNMLRQITSDLKSYLEARIDLLFLSVTETMTRWVGLSVQRLLGLSVLLLGFLFALIAAAIAIGEWLNNAWLGYLIISLPMLISGVYMTFSKPSVLSRNIQKQLMSDMLKSLDEKELRQKELTSGEANEEVER